MPDTVSYFGHSTLEETADGGHCFRCSSHDTVDVDIPADMNCTVVELSDVTAYPAGGVDRRTGTGRRSGT